jgi:hypothetical protein
MSKMFVWLQKDEGWKTLLAITYAAICIFDFVISPIMWNIDREHAMALANTLANDATANKDIAMKMLDSAWRTHVPYTLQGTGMFHLAFGALLTGSAISKFREKL